MDDPRFWDDGGGGGARYNGRRERKREQEMQMSLLGASAEGAGSEGGGEGSGSGEEERSETRLLWELGWPLLIARVADEVSWLSIYAFWGQMGSAVSGAGYDAYTGMQFTLVFIFGAQQALYTMVPQATGAGNTTQVGALLQLVLFWTTVVLGVPTALSWAFMGDLMLHFNMLADAPSDCGVSVGNGTNATAEAAQDLADMYHEADLIESYGQVSVLYLLPYVWVVGLTTWLESVEEVQEAETIAALGSLLKAGLSWVFMFKHDHLPGFLQGYELNGFAYASTVGYSVQLGLLLYIVFHLRRHHAQYWRGWCAQCLLPGCF